MPPGSAVPIGALHNECRACKSRFPWTEGAAMVPSGRKHEWEFVCSSCQASVADARTCSKCQKTFVWGPGAKLVMSEETYQFESLCPECNKP